MQAVQYYRVNAVFCLSSSSLLHFFLLVAGAETSHFRASPVKLESLQLLAIEVTQLCLAKFN